MAITQKKAASTPRRKVRKENQWLNAQIIVTQLVGKTFRVFPLRSTTVSSVLNWWLMIGIALLLAGCGGKTPQLAKLGANDVIVAFGDSLTYGTGAAEHESYPAVLAQVISRTVVRAGVPGEVTAQGLQRLPDVLAEHKPRLVIVCLGGNDMLRQVSEAEITANLRAIVRKVRDSGAQAILIGVPRPALLTSAPKFYEEIAKEFAIPYEGSVVTSVLYKSDLKSDAIHPNAHGYRKIAEALAALLRKAGAV
jgi:acyl-CoA thioesterase I